MVLKCEDVMPRSDGSENLKVLKKRSWKVDIGPCRQKVGLSAIEADSRSWVQTMVLRSWGPTKQLGFWGWTMEDDGWVPAIGA